MGVFFSFLISKLVQLIEFKRKEQLAALQERMNKRQRTNYFEEVSSLLIHMQKKMLTLYRNSQQIRKLKIKYREKKIKAFLRK